MLLGVVGLYVSYYGLYELRLYLGDGPASDPVVDAAGQVQDTLAGWVDRIGPLPLLLALAVLLGRGCAAEQRGLPTRARCRHTFAMHMARRSRQHVLRIGSEPGLSSARR